MVVVDVPCLRSFSKIRREPLMHTTSDAIMLQFISQNSIIYSNKRSLSNREKRGRTGYIDNFLSIFVPVVFTMSKISCWV